MKLSMHKEVLMVIQILKKIDDACKDVEKSKAKIAKQTNDIDRIPGITSAGYNLSVTEYSDGSGHSVDLDGCYVAVEVLDATLVVLMTKRGDVVQWLEDNGVVCDE